MYEDIFCHAFSMIKGCCEVSRPVLVNGGATGGAIEEPFPKKTDLMEKSEPWVLFVGNKQFRFHSHNAKLILSEAVGKALAVDFD